jgi:serine/threonine-protein kinase
MEPVADQRIYSNRYQVTHLIARGGMAMVYRAHDLLLNRYVALKILYPELSVDHNFVERFRREAQAAANLSHPNIVPIFDWGEESGTYFIVMELIEGTSLADLLRDSRTLSPAKSAQVCAQVASALSYAHRQGVVHRDVKPGNILLTTDGQVKVTDFGIAQAISTEDNLTVAGSVMGTATYFSPEQAEGALVDGRSDVYSLGVVLYELLAGRPPFMGDTPVAVASKHVRETTPSPRQFNPTLPTDLEAITMHALAKSPSDRYQTADEMRADLLRFTEGHPVSVTGRHLVMGDDVTRAVAAVPAGERTQAVPIMNGPRTDVRRRRRGRGGWIASGLALVLVLAGVLAYFLTATHQVTKMPNLVGLSIAAATATVRQDGLQIGLEKLVPSDKPIETVVRTSPKPGTKIEKGQSVTLYVSQGQSTTPVTIPQVLHESLGLAQQTLQNALLSVSTVFTTTNPGGYQPDTVINESPPGGTKGHTGDTVTLIVVSSSATYPLPDVSGQTKVQAAATLGNSGLTIASKTAAACSNTVGKGLVVSTVPAAGTSVSAGQAIELITSSGVCQITVPNVVGATEAQATSQLEATTLGLVPSFTYLDSTDPLCNPGGTPVYDYVAAQTPLAYSSAPFGSTVDLEYCPPASSTTTTTPPTTTTTS